MSDIIEEKYHEIIFNLLKVKNEEPKILTLSKKSYKHFKDFHDFIEVQSVDELEDIDEWTGKFVGTVLRIAGLLHLALCARNNNFSDLEVSENTMLSAISIGNYYLEHAKAAFRFMCADADSGNAKYLLRRIEQMEKHEFTKRDLFDICKGKFKNVEVMEKPLQLLAEMGYIREETVSTGGRPSTKIYVNPLHKSSKSSNTFFEE